MRLFGFLAVVLAVGLAGCGDDGSSSSSSSSSSAGSSGSSGYARSAEELTPIQRLIRVREAAAAGENQMVTDIKGEILTRFPQRLDVLNRQRESVIAAAQDAGDAWIAKADEFVAGIDQVQATLDEVREADQGAWDTFKPLIERLDTEWASVRAVFGEFTAQFPDKLDMNFDPYSGRGGQVGRTAGGPGAGDRGPGGGDNN